MLRLKSSPTPQQLAPRVLGEERFLQRNPPLQMTSLTLPLEREKINPATVEMKLDEQMTQRDAD